MRGEADRGDDGGGYRQGRFRRAGAAVDPATWSPDPTKAPNYVDTGLKPDGTIDPLVNAKLAANSILAMIPQYLPSLQSMEAISMEVGDKDFLLQDNIALDAELTKFGIAHGYALYDGDHGNRIKDRIRSDLLPSSPSISIRTDTMKKPLSSPPPPRWFSPPRRQLRRTSPRRPRPSSPPISR